MALLLGLWRTLRGSDRYNLARFYLRPLRYQSIWSNYGSGEWYIQAIESKRNKSLTGYDTRKVADLATRMEVNGTRSISQYHFTRTIVIAMNFGHNLMTLSDLKCIIWKDMFMSEDSNLPSHLLCIIIVHSNIIILGLWSFFSLLVLSLTSLLCPARPKIRQHNPLISRLHTSLHKPQPHSRLNQLWNLGYVL